MFRTATALIFTLLFLLSGIVSAQALTIQNVRGGTHPDKMRLVIELDTVGDFRVFLANDPQRLVVELPDARMDDHAVVELGRIGINELRTDGMGSRLGRLSFMLRQPVRVISAFMLPRAEGKPDRLVVDYKPTSTADYESATRQTLGTLSGRAGTGGGSGVLGVLTRPAPVATSRQGQSKPAGLPAPTQTEQAAVLPLPAGPDADDAAPRDRKYVVVVDAGHGGKDPGAIGVGGVYEKGVTLAAARELARQLEETGRYRVVMTRNADKFILLPDRVRIARRAKADLFISLHADMSAGNPRDTEGLSIYTLSDKASDAQTEKLAAQENKVDLLAGVDLSHEQEDVANILIDLAMRENMNQSRFFAGKVVRSMGVSDVPLLERPHRYAGFAVLKAPDIPSVLVEMGFLSNPVEARRLQDEAHRRRLMRGLVNGIDGYFAHLEQNQRQ